MFWPESESQTEGVSGVYSRRSFYVEIGGLVLVGGGGGGRGLGSGHRGVCYRM